MFLNDAQTRRRVGSPGVAGVVICLVVPILSGLQVGSWHPPDWIGNASGELYGAQSQRTGKEYTNSIGMKFVRIEPGSFQMGNDKTLPPELLPIIDGGDRGGRFDLLAHGDYDERPVHSVKITEPFYMAVCEVTNLQYELFDPEHSKLRGKEGYSRDDDEAVINVSWYDAAAFCQWLCDQEGLSYRLPTEAEWEYACRAETTTNFYTGDLLPTEFQKNAGKERPLHVGKTAPNAWGLYDMHGNVEEWCRDWYGPYRSAPEVDPVGYVDGDFRVTRGGSHSTPAYYLRSANRLGALPNERHWLIGFRVIIGEIPAPGAPGLPPVTPPHQLDVVQRPLEEVMKGSDPDKPYFKGPRKFMNIPREAIGPLFAGHNHSPDIVDCPNGDLLVGWFTCVSEQKREMARGAARLRWGQQQWDEPSVFLDTPDRNDSITALWFDGKDTIYHFFDASAAGSYVIHATALRKSIDSGATWSKARIIFPEHRSPKDKWGGHMLSSCVFRMADGAIALVTDGIPTVWASHNEGLSWQSREGHINGNHPGVLQLVDGRLRGYVRQKEVEAKEVITTYTDLGKKYTHKARKWRMAQGTSSDGGRTWVREPSIFPGIGGGQRLALLRLRQGPIFIASFADRGIIITDASGQKREVRGLFAAISDDEGRTWSNIRLVSDDGPGRPVETTNGGMFAMSSRNAEYRGYLSVCQAPNGLIHLISSIEHYTFNLAWLRTAPPPLKYPPIRVKAAAETFNGPKKFDLEGWAPYHGHAGGFNGKGQYTIISRSHFRGMNRLIGEGSFEIDMAFKNIHYNPRGDTASAGITIWIKDAMMRRLHFYVREDRMDLGLADEEDPVPWPKNAQSVVPYASPPTSAKLKFIYNENTGRIRIFYGLNPGDAGNEPTTEFPCTKAGIYFGRPLTESTAAYIMMSNGQVDLDHFEIKPL